VFEIEETVSIEQPIERVWAFVMDVSSEPLPNLQDVVAVGLGDQTAWEEVATTS
jgi:uncharacterized membrane protein